MMETTKVARPVEDVFDLVADFARLTEWDPNVADVRLVEGEPLHPGVKFEVDVRFLGRTTTLLYELTAIDRNVRAEYVATGNTARTHDRLDFEEVEGGTRINFRADVTLTGVGRLLRPVIKRVSRQQVADAMENLGQVLG